MSTWYPYRFTCPSCGGVTEIQLLKGIHVGRLPSVKADIREGRFQRHTCGGCAHTVQVEVPSVYTDLPNGQYIAIEAPFPEDARAARDRQRQVFDRSFTFGPDIASTLGGTIRHRLVFGVAALREKVLAWDAGLDDRVLECLKLDLLEEAGTLRTDLVLRLVAVLPGQHLMFGRLRPPPRVPREALPVPQGGAIGPGSPRPAGGALSFRRAGPEVLEPVTVPDRRYQQALLRRLALLRAHPWLGDEWVVDAFDGCPVAAEGRKG